MSSLEIMSVDPTNGAFEYVAELHNSWMGGILAWDLVWDKYGEKRHEYDNCLLNGGEDGRLWELQHDPRLSRSERVVFCLTFTRFYVKADDYERLSIDITEAFNGKPLGHWAAIIALMRDQPDIPALGFRWTTVSENPFAGDWNEEREDYDPIDPASMVNVYDHVARLESELA